MRTARLAVVLAAVIAPAVLASGCAARVYSAPPPSAPLPYGPDLVYAGPGVQVIADYSEPIFFADGFYWRFYGGHWYRSSYYTGGWVYYSRPPVVIARIDRPHAYVHYRPMGWRGRGVAPAPAPMARPAPAPGPGWRGQAQTPPSRPAPPPQQTWRGRGPSTPPPAASPRPAPGPSWRGRGNDRFDRR
jgi:hypothetical protein